MFFHGCDFPLGKKAEEEVNLYRKEEFLQQDKDLLEQNWQR